jgi:hypothetical protein
MTDKKIISLIIAKHNAATTLLMENAALLKKLGGEKKVSDTQKRFNRILANRKLPDFLK